MEKSTRTDELQSAEYLRLNPNARIPTLVDNDVVLSLIDQIRARGGVDPDRIVNALAQALRQEFGSDPGRMPLQAIVFSANRR
jgi:hypothetical protein